jgi:diguanylate cyclase (GGDEF)-like protein
LFRFSSDVAGFRRHFLKQVVLPLCFVVLGLVAITVLGLYWATKTSNQVSAERQASVTTFALLNSAQQIAHEQQSIADWPQLLQQLSRSPLDQEWLDAEVGSWLSQVFDHDLVFILDPENREIYGHAKGGDVIRLNSVLDDLMPLLDSARASISAREEGSAILGGSPLVKRRPGIDYQAYTTEVLDRPAAASVMSLRSSGNSSKPFLLVSVRFLDGDYLRIVSAWGLLDGLRFSDAQVAAPGETMVTLSDERGKSIGNFFWKPELPGDRVLRILGPAAAVLILLVTVLAGILAWSIWRSGRELNRAVVGLRASEAQAQHLAFHDVLTGLANRSLYRDRLDQAVAGAQSGHSFAVLALDLDRFKQVNDTLGHAAGDNLIREFAGRLSAVGRSADTVARIGGDEFSILLVEVEEVEDVERFCERLLGIVRDPFELLGHQVHVGLSIGVALSSTSGLDSGDLLRKADIALYRAKSEGRDCYRIFSPAMDESVQLRRELERDLRRAISNENELYLHYQPEVDAKSHEIVGLESLLRWKHPTRGTIMPNEFIPLAEETGIISRLSEWTLRQACASAVRWPSVYIAVNLSAAEFRSRNLASRIIGIARDVGCPPSQIELEITEGVLMAQDGVAPQVLAELRQAGFRVALDDFGTGYSSLSYLRRFKVDKIKIDRSFVTNLGSDPEADAIISSVITMGHAMGLTVTAEGVETSRQKSLLSVAGCNEMQGYLFSRALPAEAVTELLKTATRPRELAHSL